MTFPLLSAFVTVKAPLAYSFCASMMMSAESVGDAVESGMPSNWRKDFGAIAMTNEEMCWFEVFVEERQ
jgi:hypothetical protein